MNRNPIVSVPKFTLAMLATAFAQGRFASAKFVKNDGTVRVINGKSKILSALKGGEATYDASARGQLRVADVNIINKAGERETGYRTVTAEKLISISANGKQYVLAGEVKVKPEFINGVIVQGNTVRVGMNGKDTYEFVGVPTSLGLNFRDAENKGEFFNLHIKNKFAYTKLS